MTGQRPAAPLGSAERRVPEPRPAPSLRPILAPLAAKLAPPRTPSPLVVRPRLLDRLSRAVRSPVTLVIAPAGWGKSALLSSWVTSGIAPYQVAWVSLGPEDGAPGTWWSSVLAALGQCLDGPGRSGAQLLAEPDPMAQLERMLRACTGPVVLVLDDLHEAAGTEVTRELDELLRHQPPRLHLVLASRTEPDARLHRLRVAGEVQEIRAADLAFDHTETEQLLAALPGPSAGLTGDVMATTQGWAAGLRLMAGAFARDSGRTLSAVGAEKNERGEPPRAVTEFLRREVLVQQPEAVREFLLRTCVVDHLWPGLAEVLACRGDAGQQLEELWARQLFITRDGAVFRYHPLLLAMLRRELAHRSLDEVAELHLRAAHWYQGTGDTPLAVRHAVAGHDFKLAGSLIGAAGFDLVADGSFGALQALLDMLPAAPRAAASDPQLALLLAVRHLLTGDLSGADRHLFAARSGDHRVPRGKRDEFVLHRATVELHRSRLTGGAPAAAADRARAELHEAAPAGAHAMSDLVPALLRVELGSVQGWLGELDEARAQLERGLEVIRHAGAAYPLVSALSQLAMVRTLSARPMDARLVAEEALARAKSLGWRDRPISRSARIALAWSRYEAGELDAARATLSELPAVSEGAQEIPLELACLLLRARLAVIAGEVAAARQLLDDAPMPGEPSSAPVLVMPLMLTRLRLLVADGELPAARRLVRDLANCRLPGGDLAVLRGLVLLGNGNAAGALAAVAPAVSMAAPFRYPYASLCGWVLTALASDRLGDRMACDHALGRAVALAQPQGLRRAFADHGPEALALLRRRIPQLRSGQAFARTLLAGGPAVPDGASAGLSDREAEVLATLPSELSYHDVAEQLYVSVNTVKTHVKSIYRKLGVATRREAVERARAEGLL